MMLTKKLTLTLLSLYYCHAALSATTPTDQEDLISNRALFRGAFRESIAASHGDYASGKLKEAFQHTVDAAKQGAEYFQKSFEETRERVKKHREAIKARLAAYEEGGSSDLHFSLECASRSFQGVETCVPEGESKCTWCNVQDVVGFCTAKEDEDVLSEWGIECGDSEDPEVEKETNEITNNYSLQCLAALSSDGCGQTSDEDGDPCVWCQYNSWIGVCVSPDDTESAEDDLYMTCGATSIA